MFSHAALLGLNEVVRVVSTQVPPKHHFPCLFPRYGVRQGDSCRENFAERNVSKENGPIKFIKNFL